MDPTLPPGSQFALFGSTAGVDPNTDAYRFFFGDATPDEVQKQLDAENELIPTQKTIGSALTSIAKYLFPETAGQIKSAGGDLLEAVNPFGETQRVLESGSQQAPGNSSLVFPQWLADP